MVSMHIGVIYAPMLLGQRAFICGIMYTHLHDHGLIQCPWVTSGTAQRNFFARCAISTITCAHMFVIACVGGMHIDTHMFAFASCF